MKKIFSIALCIFISAFLFSQEEDLSNKSSAWSFSSGTDFAFYPKSDYVTGSTHFAPLTGFYSGLEARTTLHATYTIPVPFNDGALFSGNTVAIDSAIELSPVTFLPKFSVSFSPIAFLNFKAGANIGTGWKFLGIKALSVYDSDKREYVQQDPFKTWFYQLYTSGTIMFDTAAIFPGDWNHVVAVASFEIDYTGLLNANKHAELFQWQTTGGKVQGLEFISSYILGYQMPLKLSMAGIMIDTEKYINENNFENKYKLFNGTFNTITINPLVQITFNKNDSILLLASFANRRSFEEEHTSTEEEPLLTYSGNEWLFRRIACSWSHKF